MLLTLAVNAVLENACVPACCVVRAHYYFLKSAALMFLIVRASTSGALGRAGSDDLVPLFPCDSAPTGPPGKFVCVIEEEGERHTYGDVGGRESGGRVGRTWCVWGGGEGVISKIYGAALHKMHASCN